MIQIKDFLSNNDLTVSLPNGTTLIDNKTVRTYYLVKYNSFVFPFDSELLKDLWTVFWQENATNLKRTIDAFNMDYNPINNYDRTETITKKSNDKTENNLTDSEQYGNKNTKENVSAFDSSALQPSSETVESEFTNKKTHGGTISNTGTETITNKTSGNIGVTTSQQMIESELEMRKKQVVFSFLDMFAKQYFLYFGGVE